MTSKQKIIAMTKMAQYDKNEGPADRVVNDYYRHDYVYKKNLGTRLCVGIASLAFVALYWLKLLFIDGIDIFEADLPKILTDSGKFVVVILAFYSVAGTIQGTRQYYLMQKRLEKYTSLTEQLERINDRLQRKAETPEAAELFHGTDTDSKRSRRKVL
jgi:hypothetical protein